MKKYELYRTERDKGLTYQQIADKYGVSKQNVAQACQGKQKKAFPFLDFIYLYISKCKKVA